MRGERHESCIICILPICIYYCFISFSMFYVHVQAIKWSNHYFGTPTKAGLFRIIESRSDEEKQNMVEQRKWKALIKNVKFTNLDEKDSYFLKFNIGYNFKVKKRVKGISFSYYYYYYYNYYHYRQQ